MERSAQTIDTLEGRPSWNGRDLGIDAFRVVLPEGQLQGDGRVTALLDNSAGLDLHLGADANLAALAPWAQLTDPVVGALHADAAITGSLTSPHAVLAVTGRDISAAGLQGVAIQAGARVGSESAELSTFTARAAGGTISAHGQASLTGGMGAIRLDWRQLDLATLMRQALRRDTILLAARVEGSSTRNGQRHRSTR